MKVKASSNDSRQAGSARPVHQPWKPIADQLRILVQPESYVELRSIGVSRVGHRETHTESAHFCNDQLDQLVKAALTINHRAEGVYFTLNPLSPYPSLDGRAATDADVMVRRWLLIDCDPCRPSKCSATDEEKARAETIAAKVEADLTDAGWPQPVVADSGNGYHLLYRIDLPTDDEGLIRRVLRGLANRYDTDDVKIDTSVFNPSRICKLYGTTARKGKDEILRPHRASSILRVPSDPVIVEPSLLEMIAGVVPDEPVDHRRSGQPAPSFTDPLFEGGKKKGLVVRAGKTDVIGRAETYVDRCQPAISGQGGHDQTYKVAIAVGPGFDLDPDEAYRILLERYNPRCEPPWSEKELRRKIDEAYRTESKRGWHLKVSHKSSDPETRKDRKEGDEESGISESAEDPHRLARLCLKSRYYHQASGCSTLAYWAEEWYRWHDGAWKIISSPEIGAEVTRFVKHEMDRLALESQKTARPVTTGLVSNVMQAMRDLAHLSILDLPKQPAWLGDKDEEQFGDPISYLSARNAIVHLPSLVDGQSCTYTPTPRFFSPTNVGYDFDPSVPAPEAWMNFLTDLWPNDPQSISCLQEWFGYLLTPDTSQGKMLMLIGPKRSGKGTIGRVLQGLVGHQNIAAPTLASLEKNFGLQPLIGKLIAIIGDARLSGRADSQAIVERLLSISGQDTQTIDRKNRSFWTGSLPTRFILISNELPRLADASGALPSRMILLRLTRSFYGLEDTCLTEKLLAERSAILLWAIAGWDRLRKRGEFVQPETGKEYLEDLLELSSPTQAFVDDECAVGPDETVLIPDLFAAFKEWCKQRGKEHHTDEAGFGRNLRAAVPAIQVIRPRTGGTRVRAYRGIGLSNQPSGEAF